MEGTMTLSDGTAIPVTGLTLEESEGAAPHGSGFVTAAGGQLRTQPREGSRLVLRDGRQGAVRIDDVQTKVRTGMPAITTVRFSLLAGWG